MLMCTCDCRHVKEHATNSGKATHNHVDYSKEKHSLQGKHGKTHAVC
jgi:glutamate decarboxylase